MHRFPRVQAFCLDPLMQVSYNPHLDPSRLALLRKHQRMAWWRNWFRYVSKHKIIALWSAALTSILLTLIGGLLSWALLAKTTNDEHRHTTRILSFQADEATMNLKVSTRLSTRH